MKGVLLIKEKPHTNTGLQLKHIDNLAHNYNSHFAITNVHTEDNSNVRKSMYWSQTMYNENHQQKKAYEVRTNICHHITLK